MRFLTFETQSRSSWGVATDAGIVDIGARQGGSLLETLQAGELSAITDVAAAADADFGFEDIIYLPPVHAPEKIACNISNGKASA
jgi:hypothetical protein